MDRGLAVLDAQTSRLYDPRGAIPLTLRLGDETIVPYLPPSLLSPNAKSSNIFRRLPQSVRHPQSSNTAEGRHTSTTAPKTPTATWCETSCGRGRGVGGMEDSRCLGAGR